MKVLLARHATCVDAYGEIGEFDRYLTESGRREVLRAGAAIAEQGLDVVLALTSPLVRAVQTAEIMVSHLSLEGEVRSSMSMAPGADPTELLKALSSPRRTVLAVGHAPDMRARAAFLLGIERGRLPMFAKSMVMCLDVAEPREGGATFEWAYLPETREVVRTLAELR